MKKFYIILSALFIEGSVSAQSCLPEGITFTTQDQVDGFQSNYPGCVAIEGDVIIKGGNSIIDLTGLNVLTSIGGNLAISFNYILTSLAGLDGLNSIGGDLNIFGNTFLTSLTGLDSIDAGSVINLRIVGNDTLSTCAIQSICNYLLSPNGTIEIYNNASGCNSQQEVEVACIYLSTGEITLEPAFSIFPNPTLTSITISTPTTPEKNTFMTIYNISGQQLLMQRVTKEKTLVDISGLQSGVYLLKVMDDRTVMVGKFVKNYTIK